MNTPQRTINDIFDLQRAMSIKISVENGKICNQTTMGERLERINQVWIVDETDCSEPKGEPGFALVEVKLDLLLCQCKWKVGVNLC